MSTRRSNEISVKHREVKEARNNTQDSEIRRSSAPTYQKENLTKVRAAAFAASPLPADASCSFVNQFFAHSMCLFLVTCFHNVFHASFFPLLRDTRYLSLLPSSNPGERKGIPTVRVAASSPSLTLGTTTRGVFLHMVAIRSINSYRQRETAALPSGKASPQVQEGIRGR